MEALAPLPMETIKQITEAMPMTILSIVKTRTLVGGESRMLRLRRFTSGLSFYGILHCRPLMPNRAGVLSDFCSLVISNY